MVIKDITIKNFKGFRDIHLDFDGKSTILFGVNGVGKSSILDAINYIIRVFLVQMTPAQSKAYEKLRDDIICVGENNLEITSTIRLNEDHTLKRMYSKSSKNSRTSEATYSKTDYYTFRDTFRELYLSDDESGMPIFVHYGTNRAVLDIPDRIRAKHNFDQLSAIERAIDLQLDFRTFFEWYREREADEVLKIKESPNYQYSDPALGYVRQAIESMIGDVTDLQIKRSPVRMVVNKAGREIRVDMLSDGEKCTLALFGDLARRLILANPKANNPLQGKGIVLIDEVELHMHPSWQRRILHVLKEVFPNIQFIITTHSPQVLGEAGLDFKIYSLGIDGLGNGKIVSELVRMDGYDSNIILEDYMGTSSESLVKRNLTRSINEMIRKGNYSSAETMLRELAELSGEDDAEYILAKGFLNRRKRG